MQQPAPVPPSGAAATSDASGMRGMFKDPSTLAATGLIGAVVFATFAGILGLLADPAGEGMRGRLLSLTDTVDVGDVALLGIAVALLLLTPDPPGGISRPRLLEVASALACVITIYGAIRAVVVLTGDGSVLLRVDGFVATVGVALAAATVAFYAAKESFLKQQGRI